MKEETGAAEILKHQDAETARVYDIYRRASSIYRRAAAAMGRSPKYVISMSSTKSVRLGNERIKSS